MEANVTDLPLPLKPGFDLILARHPDVFLHAADWRRALTGSADRLAVNGMLLVTTYSAPEYERVYNWLVDTALIPLTFLPEGLTAVGLAGRDSYVLTYCRRGPSN